MASDGFREYRGSQEKWGFRDFLQIAGLSIGVGLLSMYVTQKTILQSLEEQEYRRKTEDQHLRYIIDSERQQREEDCRLIRRRINNLEMKAGIAGPFIGEKNNG